MIPRSRLFVAVFGIWVVWGSMFLCTKTALTQVPPYLISSIRFSAAGAILFILHALRGGSFPNAREWLNSGVIALFLLLLGNGSTTFAQQFNTTGLASIISATATIWIALFSILIGKSLKRLEWFGVTIGFIGVFLLARDGLANANWIGLAVGLIGTLSWSVGSVASQKLALPDGLMRPAAQMLFGAAMQGGVAFARGESLPASINPIVAFAWVALVFGAIMGYGSYVYLLSHSRVALATSYTYMNPLIALMLGSLIAGEIIGAFELIGMVVILTSVWVIWRAQAK